VKDVRITLVMVACISLGTMAAASPFFGAGAAVVYLVWSIAAGVSLRELTAKLKRVTVFLTAIIVTQSTSGYGSVLVDLGGVQVTWEGLMLGADRSFRLVLLLWGALIIARTTTLEELTSVVEGPWARPMRPLAGVVTAALAYLPMLVESARRIKARNQWRYGQRSFVGRVRLVADSALPLIAAAVRDADRLAEAMEARSYDPLAVRTPFRELPRTRVEVSLAAGAALAAFMAVAGYV
jgi:energy-coupling factor transport system permease protein